MLPGRCEREKLFDNWADSYDEAVQSDRGFPFAGYEATLDRVAALACAKPSLRALKLGIGTGNLARRSSISDLRCGVSTSQPGC